MKLYRAHNWHCFGQPSRQPYASIYTSLGCPYHCTFCCINAPFGKPGYRTRSPENVLEEIGRLVNRYGVRNIKFADELFVLKRSAWSASAISSSKRGYDLNIWAYAELWKTGHSGDHPAENRCKRNYCCHLLAQRTRTTR